MDEITANLLLGHEVHDRLDLIARISHSKLKKLFEEGVSKG